MAGSSEHTYGIFARYRGKRLTLARRIRGLDRAIAFFQRVKELRFHDKDNLELVDEVTGLAVHVDDVVVPADPAPAAADVLPGELARLALVERMLRQTSRALRDVGAIPGSPAATELVERALGEIQQARDALEAPRATREGPKRVMLVEDDSDIRTTLAGVLRDEGYDVCEAADGHEALDALPAAAPRLILLDLMLPKMNGWEVLHALGKDPVLAKIPVAVITASKEPVPNAARYLRKPVSLDVVLSVVHEYCG